MPEVARTSADTMFAILNWGVLPFWALLVFLPHWRITDFLVHSVLMPIVLGLVYAWLLAMGVFGPNWPEGAGFSSLAGVMKAFTVRELAVAGWAHYLVFDLFIGAWQVRDAQRCGMSHLLVIPCLIVTLLAGPIGLFLYLMIRGLTGRAGWSLFEG